jgi:5-methylcytosine-specific restriction enzyme A
MSFYTSARWRKKREVILRRDQYECKQCSRYGKVTQATTVHHIYPLEIYPEYRLTTENLISLCSHCHNELHDRVTNELTDKGEWWKTRTIVPRPPLNVRK